MKWKAEMKIEGTLTIEVEGETRGEVRKKALEQVMGDSKFKVEVTANKVYLDEPYRFMCDIGREVVFKDRGEGIVHFIHDFQVWLSDGAVCVRVAPEAVPHFSIDLQELEIFDKLPEEMTKVILVNRTEDYLYYRVQGFDTLQMDDKTKRISKGLKVDSKYLPLLEGLEILRPATGNYRTPILGVRDDEVLSMVMPVAWEDEDDEVSL